MAQSGDVYAFETLYAGLRPKIFSFVMKLGANPPDAEEIVQDTFFKCHRGMHNLREPRYFETWLHRIAINAFYTRHRNRSMTCNYNSVSGLEDKTGQMELVTRDSTRPDAVYAGKELVREVYDIVRTMSPPLIAVAPGAITGESTEEQVKKLKLKKGTVKSRRNRAITILVSRLVESHPELQRLLR